MTGKWGEILLFITTLQSTEKTIYFIELQTQNADVWEVMFTYNAANFCQDIRRSRLTNILIMLPIREERLLVL